MIIANFLPGQILTPPPNNTNALGLFASDGSIKRSGSNLLGSSQYLGSGSIDHKMSVGGPIITGFVVTINEKSKTNKPVILKLSKGKSGISNMFTLYKKKLIQSVYIL